jgi:hypothetical protein
MVTESTSGYILNLEIYAGEGKKLQETIFTLLEPYLDQNYHVYQDIYYNHVTTAETLLSRQVRVCGTIRVNRGLPPAEKAPSCLCHSSWPHSSDIAYVHSYYKLQQNDIVTVFSMQQQFNDS